MFFIVDIFSIKKRLKFKQYLYICNLIELRNGNRMTYEDFLYNHMRAER